MYYVKNSKKVSFDVPEDSLVENFDWKGTNTWLVVGGIVLAVIFIILLIVMLTNKKPESYKSKRKLHY
jgi:preprotein translocase subunit SecG